MTATDPRTMRRLTGDYLKRPDPLAWLAAADHCEECGDADAARLWRKRGEWFGGLHARFAEARDARPGRYVACDCGPFRVTFRRTPSCVAAAVDRPGAASPARVVGHLTNPRLLLRRGETAGDLIRVGVDPRRHVARLLEVIDEMAALEPLTEPGPLDPAGRFRRGDLPARMRLARYSASVWSLLLDGVVIALARSFDNVNWRVMDCREVS